MTDKIKVFVRLRPVAVEGAPDVTNGYDEVMNYSDYRVRPLQGKEAERGKEGYVFQRVFAPTCENSEVFKEVREVTSAALDGISGTILAYGQTATGKTHTMRGSETDPGVTERVVNLLFKEISRRQDWSYSVEVAYFEIYNEKVFDLLSSTSKKDLEVRCDNVQGLHFDTAKCADEAKASLLCGEANRKKSKTDLNEYSSRSHTVFRVQITGVSGGKRRRSLLHLVDLAGSENAKAAGYSDDTAQRQEGGAINKSLLALTNVIKGLADKKTHINYRDSKLTRILQNSLGGSARTCIICCITAAKKYFAETMSTIHFANRAGVVFNTVKVNEVDGSRSVPWDSYCKILALYKEDLEMAQTREQKLIKQMTAECAQVLQNAHNEAMRNEEVHLEMDYQSQQHLSSLRTQLATIQKEAAEQKASLENELDFLKGKQEELQQKVAEKEGVVDKTGEVEALKEEASELEEKVKKSEKEMKKLTSELTKVEKQAAAVEGNLEKVNKKLKAAEEKAEELTSDAKLKDDLIEKLESKTMDMEVAAAKEETLSEENKKLRQECEEKAATITGLKRSAEEAGAPSKRSKTTRADITKFLKTKLEMAPLRDLSNSLNESTSTIKKAPRVSTMFKDLNMWPV